MDPQWRTIIGLSITALFMALLSGCLVQRPIQVGFSGELTGRNADLGVQGRNGAQLAVERINAEGGIAGRPLELLVRDDLGTPEGAQTADRKLIDAGVVAIIGHMTSGQSMAGVAVTNEAGIVLLSPTTSTPALSGRKDFFFRVNPVNALAARTMADHIYRTRGLARVAVICDDDNASYTLVYLDAFVGAYETLGGQITGKAHFSSAQKPDFRPLVDQLQHDQPEALLIITSDVDAALIAQQARLAEWDVPLFAAGWAQTEALLQNGGTAVEAMDLVINYDLNNETPALRAFQRRYRERFGRESSFAAAQSYEAMLLLAASLEKTDGDAETLPQALVTTEIEGLIGPLSLDAYGDVVRPQFLVTVQDGAFVTQQPLKPRNDP